MTEWKNTECSFYSCADRTEQARLRDDLNKKEEDRKQLHTRLLEIKNILKREKTSKKPNEEDIKVLTQKNIELHSEVEEHKERANTLQAELTKRQNELTDLISYKTSRQEKDKLQVQQMSEAIEKSKRLVKDNEEIQLQLDLKKHEFAKMDNDIKRGKEEINIMLVKEKELTTSIKNLKEEFKLTEQQLKDKHKKDKANEKALKPIHSKLRKVVDLKTKLRYDKIKKMEPKIKKLYEKLNEEQKTMIIKQIEEAFKIGL